jgi:hypothetical protein
MRRILKIAMLAAIDLIGLGILISMSRRSLIAGLRPGLESSPLTTRSALGDGHAADHTARILSREQTGCPYVASQLAAVSR